jgi:hypothetical protein
MTNIPYVDSIPPTPTFISLSSQQSTSSSLIGSSANFYRNITNTNRLLVIPMGTFINQSGIYVSSNTLLPTNTYTITNPTANIIYPNGVDIKVLTDIKCYYNICIEYKLTKSDGTNYSNQREIRLNLMQSDGITPYNPAMLANIMPDSGSHDKLIINGYINHQAQDLVKLGFAIVQDMSGSDMSDTLLTIFGISINIL